MGRSKQYHSEYLTADEFAKKLTENKKKCIDRQKNETYSLIKKKLQTDPKYVESCKEHIETVTKEIDANVYPNRINSDIKHVQKLQKIIDKTTKKSKEIPQKTDEIKERPPSAEEVKKWCQLGNKIKDSGTYEFKTKTSTFIVSNGTEKSNDLSYIHMAVGMLPTLNIITNGRIYVNIGNYMGEIELKFVEKYPVITKNTRIYGNIYHFQKEDIMKVVFGYAFIDGNPYKIRVTAIMLPYEEMSIKEPAKVLFDHSAIFIENKWNRI
jgi:hypothetical protein